ncbi:MAG: hypothetical protein WCV88_04370 [Patescibacteria group bacterium]|jgi:hypothetical protein
MKLYQDILRSAWRHTIQRPGLWVFGFFATFIFGASGEIDRYLRFMDNESAGFTGWLNVIVSTSQALALGSINLWLLVIGIGVAGLILIYMMSVSAGALIHSAKWKTESFTEAFLAGQKHVVQLAVLFVSSIMFLSILTVVMASVVSQHGMEVVVLVSVVGVIPVVIIASFLVRLTAMVVVLDNVHIGQAFIRASRIFAAHWLVILEMSIVSFVVVFVVNLLLLLGLVIMCLPMLVTITMAGLLSLVFYGQYVYLGLSLFSAAIISTWQWSAWTYLFGALQTRQPKSTLVGWISGARQ